MTEEGNARLDVTESVGAAVRRGRRTVRCDGGGKRTVRCDGERRSSGEAGETHG